MSSRLSFVCSDLACLGVTRVLTAQVHVIDQRSPHYVCSELVQTTKKNYTGVLSCCCATGELHNVLHHLFMSESRKEKFLYL
ncbi:hypothetical protein F5141DRAFT_1079221 [Pisolithus sp. B1]|nr:hypothetical protein F5141DRAFT_1079221 [Pisolithus sp. B1]